MRFARPSEESLRDRHEASDREQQVEHPPGYPFRRNPFGNGVERRTVGLEEPDEEPHPDRAGAKKDGKRDEESQAIGNTMRKRADCLPL